MVRTAAPGLLAPITIKGRTLRNRIVMPPMASHLSPPDGSVTQEHLDRYVPRAAAGVGLVMVEHCYVVAGGRTSDDQLGIHDDTLIDGHARLCAEIRATGAVTGVQLNHGGGKVPSSCSGHQPVSASAGVVPRGQEECRAATVAEIEEYPRGFAHAARRAIAAGYDLVEIHGAHGYLLSQFLSPLVNRRDDRYGGDPKRRLALPCAVVRAVRAVVGPDYWVQYRLGALDYKPGGLDADAAVAAARALIEAGVDSIHISGGVHGPQAQDWDGTSEGYHVDIAARVRAAVTVPVIVPGAIRTPAFADRVVRDGKADLVAVGTAMLDNPRWAADAIEALAGSSRSRIVPNRSGLAPGVDPMKLNQLNDQLEAEDFAGTRRG